LLQPARRIALVKQNNQSGKQKVKAEQANKDGPKEKPSN